MAALNILNQNQDIFSWMTLVSRQEMIQDPLPPVQSVYQPMLGNIFLDSGPNISTQCPMYNVECHWHLSLTTDNPQNMYPWHRYKRILSYIIIKGFSDNVYTWTQFYSWGLTIGYIFHYFSQDTNNPNIHSSCQSLMFSCSPLPLESTNK